jgi:hypothetical protein
MKQGYFVFAWQVGFCTEANIIAHGSLLIYINLPACTYGAKNAKQNGKAPGKPQLH